jgi:hypothetical protein
MSHRHAAADAGQVEDRIRSHLAGGVRLDEATLDFLASTHGAVGAGEVEDLLSDAGETDVESLLELLFFPDLPLQVSLEGVLDGRGLEDGSLKALVRSLSEAPAQTLFVLPAGGGRLSMAMPPGRAPGFVDRLRLGWSLPAPLRPRLSAAFPGDGPGPSPGMAEVLVRLRNAGLPATAFQTAFLDRFFLAFPADRPDYLDHLACLAGFLSETPEAADPYDALMGKKAFWFRQLQQARKARALLEKSNFETLVMSGMHVPAMDTAAAVQAMERIDALALRLFGRTDPFDANPSAVDLGEVGADAGVDGISRLLSG